MKTVKRGEDVKRVQNEEAEKAIREGWVYCPKSEWKALRDSTKAKGRED